MSEIKFKEYPFDSSIKRALSELGYVYPLEVQSLAIPKILNDTDLIVQSQTGSGKTAAFAIPLCEKIDIELVATQAVILVPTRELALQVSEELAQIGQFKGVRVACIYGKQPIDMQRKILKSHPHVVVATPGRLLDHIVKRNTRLRDVRYLVIDEADEMFLMGFQDQLEAIIKKVPDDRVTLLFSATMPTEVEYFTQLYMKQPERLEVVSQVTTVDKIEQLYYAVDGLKKVDFIKKMLRHERPTKAVIFCNTQNQVDRLFEILKKWDEKTCMIHGGMEQQDRTEAIKGFKKGIYKYLVATDVVARGIHVEGISHVINYSVPFEHEQYVHRIGRTGRVDENGVAITLVMPSEMDRFKDLEVYLTYSIPCRGGHVQIAPKATDRTSKRQRYKEERLKQQGVVLQLNVGRGNSTLKQGEILAAIRSIDGVTGDDIGKIEMREIMTSVVMFNGKEAIVLKAMRTKKIKGKQYRVKRG